MARTATPSSMWQPSGSVDLVSVKWNCGEQWALCFFWLKRRWPNVAFNCWSAHVVPSALFPARLRRRRPAPTQAPTATKVRQRKERRRLLMEKWKGRAMERWRKVTERRVGPSWGLVGEQEAVKPVVQVRGSRRQWCGTCVYSASLCRITPFCLTGSFQFADNWCR